MPVKAGQSVSAEEYDIKMARRIRARAEENRRRSEGRRRRILRCCDMLLHLLETDPDFGLRRVADGGAVEAVRAAGRRV